MAIQFVHCRNQCVIRRDNIHQGRTNRARHRRYQLHERSRKPDRKAVWKFEKMVSNLASNAVTAAGSGATASSTDVTLWSNSCVLTKLSGSRRSAQMSLRIESTLVLCSSCS